jgi:hypothetical protein
LSAPDVSLNGHTRARFKVETARAAGRAVDPSLEAGDAAD